MKTRIVVVALITIAAGGFAFTRVKNVPPSDFRDAVAERSPEFNTDIPTFENNDKNIPIPKAMVPVPINPNTTTGAPDFKISFYRAMNIERERAEQAVKAINAQFGESDRIHAKAASLYNDVKPRIYAWIGITKIRLAGGASIYSKDEYEYLLDAVSKNEIFVSYVAKSTIGFYPAPSVFENLSSCSLFSSCTIKKWLKEIQVTYNDADSVGKDKILEDIEALDWKFFGNIKSESSSQADK